MQDRLHNCEIALILNYFLFFGGERKMASWVIERSREMKKEQAIAYLQRLLHEEEQRKRKLKEKIKWLSKVIKDLKREIKRRRKEE